LHGVQEVASSNLAGPTIFVMTSVNGPKASVASAGCFRKLAAVVTATLGWPWVFRIGRGAGGGEDLHVRQRGDLGAVLNKRRVDARREHGGAGGALHGGGEGLQEGVGVGSAQREDESGLGAELAAPSVNEPSKPWAIAARARARRQAAGTPG
jgi:hypothetical protein